MKKHMKIEVHQGVDKQWYVRLVGGNGAIMMASEGYAVKSNAVRAAKNLSQKLWEEALGLAVVVK